MYGKLYNGIISVCFTIGLLSNYGSSNVASSGQDGGYKQYRHVIVTIEGVWNHNRIY
jgi:hypothetical protein